MEMNKKLSLFHIIYFYLYLIGKIGMVYFIINFNWLALIGYTLLTTVSYVETMKRW